MARQNESFFHFTSFAGGYFTDVPSSQLQPGELLVAENCYWENGLTKRSGYDCLASVTCSAILGGLKVNIDGSSQYILATKQATTSGPSYYSEFHIGTVGAALSTVVGVASVDCTVGDGAANVQFDVLGDQIVAVNGVDKPKLIYADGGSYYVDTIEHYDTRTRDGANWVAGQFDGTTYTDDTTDAQDTDAADFKLFGTTISTGFFVGCDYTFNRINISTADTAVSTATMTYEYYGRSTTGASLDWVAFTPQELPTWSSAGSHGLQMNFPIGSDGSVLMEKISTSQSVIDLKYVIRGYLNATVTATCACTSLEVQHNQYLSQLFIGDTPDTVKQHKNHVFLGAGNWARISPANSLSGWRYQDYEYFHKGGEIKTMVSHTDRLLILLDGHMYGVAGNSWANWVLEDLGPHGCAAKYGAVNAQGEIYFIGTDGFVKKFDGASVVSISKHINTDIAAATLANLRFAVSDGRVWIGDPDNELVLTFDPDTFRSDAMGDGRVSFYKWTNYPVDYWLKDEAENTLYFLAGPLIYSTSGLAYDETSTTATVPITWVARLPDMNYGAPMEDKHLRKAKIRVEDVSDASYGTTTVSFYMQNKNGITSHTVTLEVPTGGGIHDAEYTMPPKMDGPEIGLLIRHDRAVGFTLRGVSLQVRKKGF